MTSTTKPTARLPDLSGAMHAHIRDTMRKPDPRLAWKDRRGFNLCGLADWISAAVAAGIPHVSAEPVATIPVEALLRYDCPRPDEEAQLDKLRLALHSARKPGTMFRWDCCAPSETKQRLHLGHADWHPDLLDALRIDDPRAYEFIYEYPGVQMTVWRRPWIRARTHATHPLEYRVFVSDGAVLALSSYCLQRPLPDSPAIREHVRTAIRNTRRLLGAVQPPFRAPAGRTAAYDTNALSFTVDVPVASDDSVLLLEGGPPIGAGADSCCFRGPPPSWSAQAAYLRDNRIPVALQQATALS